MNLAMAQYPGLRIDTLISHIKVETFPKIEKKSSPMKKKIYKDKSVDKHNYKYSYEGSKAWKNFENDLNRFIKDQEV